MPVTAQSCVGWLWRGVGSVLLNTLCVLEKSTTGAPADTGSYTHTFNQSCGSTLPYPS